MTASTTSSSKRIDAGLATLRAAVGAIFIAHGAQKLFVFGLAGTAGFFGQVGVPLPGVMGPFIAFLEFFAGIALVLGLLTRLASLGLAFNMLGAILLVHLKAGFFAPAGFEYPLVLLAASAGLILMGPGAFSVDAQLARRRGRLPLTAEPVTSRRAA